jgi:hypothetical protein
VPIHNATDKRQHYMGRWRSIVIFDLVEKPDDVGALDAIDGPGAQDWIHKSL